MARDISVRKRMENALRAVNENLESMVENRTLELEEKILRNIKVLVLPYVNKLNTAKSPADQSNYFRILGSNLKEVITPFSSTLSGRYGDLTPEEIVVATLVKEGHDTKEIAKLMRCSTNTVQAHRFNLRRKFQLPGKRANPRSFFGTLWQLFLTDL